MHYPSKLLVQIFLFTVCFYTFACKPSSQDSDTKTLDNFASTGAKVINQCSAKNARLANGSLNLAMINKLAIVPRIKYDDSLSASEKKVAEENIKLALSALPSSFHDEFVANKGILVITKNLSKECDGPAGDSSVNELASCVSTKNGLKVAVAYSPKLIRHGAVRVFGSIYSMIYLRFDFSKASPQPVGESPTLTKLKEEISQAFLADASSSLEAFSGFFSKADLAKISANIKAGAKDVFLGTATSDETKGNFADMVFMEAFDSFYCDDWSEKSTRTSFRTNFPKTWMKFGSLNADIVAHAETFSSDDSSTASSSGFGLAGYTYYPSYGGQTYGSPAGTGPYGQETYRGTFVYNGYYRNVYSNRNGYSYGQKQYIPQKTYTDSFGRIATSPVTVSPYMIGD